MRRLLIAGLILLFLGIGVFALVPWNRGLEWQIVSALEGRGFSDISLHVSGLGWRSIVLDDISFGGENAVRLENVKIDYSFTGLRSGRLESMTILSPRFIVRQQGAGWVVAGLENVQSAPSSEPFTISSLNHIIQKIPFDRVMIEKGEVSVQADSWSLLLPLTMTFDRALHKISYKAEGAQFTKGALTARAGDLTADVDFDEASQSWTGAWTIDQVNIEGAATGVPVMAGSGTLRAADNAVNVDGVLQSEDRSHRLQFGYALSFDPERPSVFTLVSGDMPWKEGRLTLKNVKIPLGQSRAINFSIQVEHVSIDELLGAMTGQRVTATGYVSGVIPLTINKKGELIFGEGQLSAIEPGMISLPPDIIPGDNEQIVLARNILADLNYTGLSIALNNDNQGNLGVTMNVEGHNPAVYDGRAVKLNVNLTGDVLDFIKQNAILFTRPQDLWENKAHE